LSADGATEHGAEIQIDWLNHSARAHPYRGCALFNGSGREETNFLLPVQKKETKKRHPGGEDFVFFPSRELP